jgi:UDP-N-acetyl-D-mannosaminuronic acid dehydrogenase
MQSVCIIGLGEIGLPVLEDLVARNTGNFEIFGMDVNQDRVWDLRGRGYDVGTEYLDCDVQIVCVYTMDQVCDVLRKIPQHKSTLISVESTIDPRYIGKMNDLVTSAKLVLFPHRYNPGDKDHRVFNLDRVMGARSDIGFDMAVDFYKNFMNPDLIHRVDFEIAGLAKVAENAYRFIEIALSEYMCLLCNDAHVDYKQLREAMVTKWNIDVKEARDGIGGHCLPKDFDILRKFLKDPTGLDIFNRLFYADAEYKRKYGTNRRS